MGSFPDRQQIAAMAFNYFSEAENEEEQKYWLKVAEDLISKLCLLEQDIFLRMILCELEKPSLPLLRKILSLFPKLDVFNVIRALVEWLKGYQELAAILVSEFDFNDGSDLIPEREICRLDFLAACGRIPQSGQYLLSRLNLYQLDDGIVYLPALLAQNPEKFLDSVNFHYPGSYDWESLIPVLIFGRCTLNLQGNFFDNWLNRQPAPVRAVILCMRALSFNNLELLKQAQSAFEEFNRSHLSAVTAACLFFLIQIERQNHIKNGPFFKILREKEKTETEYTENFQGAKNILLPLFFCLMEPDEFRKKLENINLSGKSIFSEVLPVLQPDFDLSEFEAIYPLLRDNNYKNIMDRTLERKIVQIALSDPKRAYLLWLSLDSTKTTPDDDEDPDDEAPDDDTPDEDAPDNEKAASKIRSWRLALILLTAGLKEEALEVALQNSFSSDFCEIFRVEDKQTASACLDKFSGIKPGYNLLYFVDGNFIPRLLQALPEEEKINRLRFFLSEKNYISGHIDIGLIFYALQNGLEKDEFIAARIWHIFTTASPTKFNELLRIKLNKREYNLYAAEKIRIYHDLRSNLNINLKLLTELQKELFPDQNETVRKKNSRISRYFKEKDKRIQILCELPVELALEAIKHEKIHPQDFYLKYVRENSRLQPADMDKLLCASEGHLSTQLMLYIYALHAAGGIKESRHSEWLKKALHVLKQAEIQADTPGHLIFAPGKKYPVMVKGKAKEETVYYKKLTFLFNMAPKEVEEAFEHLAMKAGNPQNSEAARKMLRDIKEN
jgi:hypothetical protein